MSGAWGLVVQLLLPIPLVFLVLLSVPSPRQLKRFVLNVCDTVLSFKIAGRFSLAHVMTTIAAVCFVTQCFVTYNKHQDYVDLHEKALADKWRHERNFWISAMCTTLWLVLNRFYQMALRSLELSETVERLQGGSGAVGGAAGSSGAAGTSEAPAKAAAAKKGE